MFDLRLTAEQLEFRDTVRDFVAQEVKPVVLHPDRLQQAERRIPIEVLEKASQMGLRAHMLSEEAGGAGADALTASIVLEELGAGDADLAMTLAETARLARLLFDRIATPAQRECFLSCFLGDDRCHLAIAAAPHDAELGWNYHRPSEGGGARAIEAVRGADGDWMLSGSARFVLNAPVAKLLLVEARGSSGMSAFLVEAGAAGLSIRDHRDTPFDAKAAGGPQLQWYHGARGEIMFERCKVPAGQLLGLEGRSRLAEESGFGGRSAPLAQAINLGVGRAAMEAAIDYAGLRVQGGRRIIEHQAIGTILADIAVQLEAARGLVWRAAFAAEHPQEAAGSPDLPLQLVAKVFTSQVVHEATERAAECFGAMGVMKDMPLHRYVHDALIFLHSVTSNSVAKFRIAEALAGYRREIAPENAAA